MDLTTVIASGAAAANWIAISRQLNQHRLDLPPSSSLSILPPLMHLFISDLPPYLSISHLAALSSTISTSVTHCKKGRGLIKVNGSPIELVKPEILRSKAFEPILLLGRHRFAEVELRICSSQITYIAAAMESLETLVAHIQALTKPEEVSQLHSLLKQSDEALRSQAPHLVPLLAELPPLRSPRSLCCPICSPHHSSSILGHLRKPPPSLDPRRTPPLPPTPRCCHLCRLCTNASTVKKSLLFVLLLCLDFVFKNVDFHFSRFAKKPFSPFLISFLMSANSICSCGTEFDATQTHLFSQI